MKRLSKFIVISLILAAFAVSMAGCGSNSVYDDLKKEGYDFKLTFDAGGAFVNNTHSITVVEVFNKNDTVKNSEGKTGIMPLHPEDPLRGNDGIFKLSKTDGKSNYFSLGWYMGREVRRDDEGNVLDSFGIPVSESGREQGYIYSDLWDFENDVIGSDVLSKGEMTLYASWIPYFNYEIYVMNESGEFELADTLNRIDLTLPEWNQRNGKQVLNNMIRNEGKTFVAAYYDAEMTQPVSDFIDGDVEYVDIEKGISTQTTIKIYTVWREGEWKTIFDAEQFIEELSDPDNAGGYYFLGADLDFTDIELPEELKNVAFEGKIIGNGFKMINVELEEGMYAESFDDLFAEIGENTEISDISFERTADEQVD